MSKTLPPIYFYFPQKISTGHLPQNATSYWGWQCAEHSISPMQSGGCFWTLQTYLHLHDHGFPCQLVETFPDEGIVVSHRDYLEDSLKPNSKVLLVCLRADVDRHPYAQLHVVQNPYQAISKSAFTLWESHFIRHWPQPSIVPRSLDRGDSFENVAFLGNEVNLISDFCASKWHDQLQNLGLKFQKKLNHNEWHDYSAVDVVLAVRQFGCKNHWRGKPASKLYSAWHAGVPAILGYESVFQAERKSDLDYLEATSLQEVTASLKQLQEQVELRRAMIENGQTRAKETSSHNMTAQWQEFLTEVAVPAYQDWCAMTSWQQNLFFKARKAFISSRPLYYNLKTKVSNLTSRN